MRWHQGMRSRKEAHANQSTCTITLLKISSMRSTCGIKIIYYIGDMYFDFLYCTSALRACHPCSWNLEDRIRSLTKVCLSDNKQMNRNISWEEGPGRYEPRKRRGENRGRPKASKHQTLIGDEDWIFDHRHILCPNQPDHAWTTIYRFYLSSVFCFFAKRNAFFNMTWQNA